MELPERFEWEGRTIACGRAGTGPDVVLCHGTPFSAAEWAPYADALSADFTVHVWDMPGYGRSSKDPAHAVDLAVQGRAFAALLAHWRLDRPHVIAHDFGGAVSLRATLFEGAAYASLMLLDVVAIPPSGSPFFAYVGSHGGDLDRLPAYVHEAILRAYIQGASHVGVRDDVLTGLVEPWTGAEGQPAFYRQIAQYDEGLLVQIEEHLAELALPVRIVWGTEDAWVPVQTGRRLAALVPDAAYEEVPGAGHLVQHDAPVAVTSLIHRWLQARTAAPGG